MLVRTESFRHAAVAAAPTFNGAESLIGIDSTASATKTVSLASQTYTAGDYLVAVGASGSGGNTNSAAGDTDDTYSVILPASPSFLGSFEGTVVSGLDANVVFTQSAARRFAGGLITISGAAAVGSNPHQQASGSGNGVSPQCPTVTTTVDNCLILLIVGSRAGYATEMAAALPSGYTLAGTANSSASSNPVAATIAVAYKTQASAGVVAAADWTNGLGTAQDWEAHTLAIRP